jgi:hypothetical protein
MGRLLPRLEVRQSAIKLKGMRISRITMVSDAMGNMLSLKLPYFLSKHLINFYSVRCYLTKVPKIGKERGR